MAMGLVCGKLVSTTISTLDHVVAGVEVEFKGAMHFNPFRGRVVAHDVVVSNPEGYKSAYLLKVEKLIYDMGLKSFVKSCAHSIEVQEVKLHGLRVNMELKGFGCSNLHEVQRRLEPRS